MSQTRKQINEYQIQNKKMWDPKCEDTHIDIFRRSINAKYNANLGNYFDLYQWSIENYPEFWDEVWKFCEVIYSKPYEKVVDKQKRINEIPEWFHGALLNYSENLLRYRDDRIALYVAGEAHEVPLRVTYNELYDKVSHYASILKKFNLQSGDRVVGYMPNGLEAVVAMLATASLGAVWSSTSPDFGVTAVLDRFIQIQPKLMFSVDKVIYGGKMHDNLEKLQKITAGLPSLEAVFVLPYDTNSMPCDVLSFPKSYFLPDILQEAQYLNDGISTIEFVQVPFGHPLCILYSSGTTGYPKCMVHSVGGTLIKHLTEHMLHGNMTRKDVIMFYTTTGWMMWNWLITSLSVGATLVLYDGSPFFPHCNAVWDLVDLLGITILGTGAKWLAMCEDKNLVPRKTHNLESLRAILSTGSPLSPHSYNYVYQNIKTDVLLGSITGGSDIISCFAGQNPTIPVYKGEIQCRLLGMAVECFTEDGFPVRGVKGELVCTKPFPCMPIYLWNDTSGEKYKKTYFNKFPGVWNHGDFCVINSVTEGIIMLGRSDGTLNPNGVRFGSAEIYNIVEAFKEIQDSVCVSQYGKHREERVVLFVKLVPSYTLTKELLSKIRTEIRKELSARHVPSVILQVADIPYTVNGKKVEVAVKNIIAGETVINKDSISNPESLNFYLNVPELQGF